MTDTINTLFDGLEWQAVDPETDGWKLGRKVRGIVRDVVGEVYFDPDSRRPQGGWRWFVDRGDEAPSTRGSAPDLLSAIAEVEAALGITENSQ